MAVQFVVENAGCVSCSELIHDALSAIGGVEGVDVDEKAGTANVRFAFSGPVTADDVDRILGAASEGSGHGYRVRSGSWVPA